MSIRVRVYVNGTTVILPGGSHPHGLYAETRAASGSGITATPPVRVNLDPKFLRELPTGEDADYEYTGPIPAMGSS